MKLIFFVRRLLSISLLGLLVACGGLHRAPDFHQTSQAMPTPQAQEVVMYAMGLLDTGYRFGGKNPEAGLDCSGMVSYVYREAAQLRLSGSAASIARSGRSVATEALRPGDLVFFNTQQKPYSHVGIYIGDGRFVHAPSSAGKVRVDRLDSSYFATRFEEARTYFD